MNNHVYALPTVLRVGAVFVFAGIVVLVIFAATALVMFLQEVREVFNDRGRHT